MTAEFKDKPGRRFQIAEAALSQLDEIEDIEKLCFSVPWSYANLEAQATGKNKLFLCASDDSGVLGYVGLTMVLDEGYIANVAVAPRARRRGREKRRRLPGARLPHARGPRVERARHRALRKARLFGRGPAQKLLYATAGGRPPDDILF